MSHSKWPMVPLGEVVEPVQRPVVVEPGTEYRTLGVKWWGEGAYERQTIDGGNTAAGTLNQVQTDDLIINKIWVRHGSVAVVSSEVDGCFGSGEFPTFEFDRSKILPAWMHWYSKTNELWQKCDALSQGTSGKNRIRPERFLAIDIPLPLLQQQYRIVQRINRISEGIMEAQKLRTEVDRTLSSFASSLHNTLSDGRVVSMRTLIKLEEDRVPIQPTELYPQVGIRGFGGGLFATPATGGDETSYKYFNRLHDRMLVLSQPKGWEGAIAVCDREHEGRFASPEYRTFVCFENECDPTYLDLIVRSDWFRRLLESATHGQGGRRERTRPERVLDLELPMPSIDLQQRAVCIIDCLNRLQPITNNCSKALDVMMPSILDRAFKGEL